MSINAVKDALPSTGTQSYSATRTAFAAGLILPLVDAAAVSAFNAEDNATAYTPYLAVHYAGSVYYYDSGDSTSAHDPAGGVIVDGSARRYIRAQGVQPSHVVLDKDLTAPPGGETFGDAYYVAAAATGAWAGHDGDYAIYSDRGWLFATPAEGWIFYLDDEACYYHVASGGTLTKGLGDLALANSSVEAKHLAFPMGLVVQAAQTTPPGSPTDRVCYIVTATATGAWAGQETKVAEYDSTAAAWLFHTPRAGDVVYDVAAGYQKYFTGSAWAQMLSSPHVVDSDYQIYSGGGIDLDSSVNWYTVVTTNFATATAHWIFADIIVWCQNMNTSIAKDLSIGLFVDTETSPRASITGIPFAASEIRRGFALKLRFHPSDTSAHDIHVKALSSDATGADLRILANSCADFQVRLP